MKAASSPKRSLHRQALMGQSGGALFVQTSYVIFVTGPRNPNGPLRQGRLHIQGGFFLLRRPKKCARFHQKRKN